MKKLIKWRRVLPLLGVNQDIWKGTILRPLIEATIAGYFYRGNWTTLWNAYTCACGQSWKNKRPAYSPSMLQRNKRSLVQKDRNMFAKAIKNTNRIATSGVITDMFRADSIYDAEAFPFSHTQALHTLQGWGSSLTSSHHSYWELANS